MQPRGPWGGYVEVVTGSTTTVRVQLQVSARQETVTIIGTSMSLATDFVYTKNKDVVGIMDVNLAFNPATGAPYPFNDLVHRPVKGWGAVNQNVVQPNGPDDFRFASVLDERVLDAQLGRGVRHGGPRPPVEVARAPPRAGPLSAALS